MKRALSWRAGLTLVPAMVLSGCVGMGHFVPPWPARNSDADTLEIIPTPKVLRLTGDTILLTTDPAPVLLLGQAPCAQARIGAEWINRRIVRLHGQELAVQTGPSDGPDAGWAFVIGTPMDSAAIRTAVEHGKVNVGDDNPGERGYEIHMDRAAQRIYLAGADPIGALYAAVTFTQLIEPNGGNPVLRAANVRDWPDMIYAMPSSNLGWGGLLGLPEVRLQRAKHKLYTEATQELSPEAYQEVLDVCQRNIDRLLAHKMGMIQFKAPHELKDQLFDLDKLKRYDVVREATFPLGN